MLSIVLGGASYGYHVLSKGLIYPIRIVLSQVEWWLVLVLASELQVPIATRAEREASGKSYENPGMGLRQDVRGRDAGLIYTVSGRVRAWAQVIAYHLGTLRD